MCRLQLYTYLLRYLCRKSNNSTLTKILEKQRERTPLVLHSTSNSRNNYSRIYKIHQTLDYFYGSLDYKSYEKNSPFSILWSNEHFVLYFAITPLRLTRIIQFGIEQIIDGVFRPQNHAMIMRGAVWRAPQNFGHLGPFYVHGHHTAPRAAAAAAATFGSAAECHSHQTTVAGRLFIFAPPLLVLFEIS